MYVCINAQRILAKTEGMVVLFRATHWCWSTCFGRDITCRKLMVFRNNNTSWDPWSSASDAFSNIKQMNMVEIQAQVRRQAYFVSMMLPRVIMKSRVLVQLMIVAFRGFTFKGIYFQNQHTYLVHSLMTLNWGLCITLTSLNSTVVKFGSIYHSLVQYEQWFWANMWKG